MRYNLIPSFAQPNSNTGVSFASPLQSLKKIYGKVKAHDVLLQCMYIVKIEDIFNNGPNIPWFKDPSLGYLVTDANISFGSSEADNYHAGALPAGYLTVKTDDDTDMTFIETGNGDIFKSYRACHELAFNKDGTVNEPRKYAFKLTVAMINHKHPDKPSPITRSWLVAVKSGSTEANSAGRSEIVKEQITFQKVRPLIFER